MSASYESLGVAMLKEDGEILEASDSIKAHILKSQKKKIQKKMKTVKYLRPLTLARFTFSKVLYEVTLYRKYTDFLFLRM
jgi:hypothetical protein